MSTPLVIYQVDALHSCDEVAFILQLNEAPLYTVKTRTQNKGFNEHLSKEYLSKRKQTELLQPGNTKHPGFHL